LGLDKDSLMNSNNQQGNLSFAEVRGIAEKLGYTDLNNISAEDWQKILKELKKRAEYHKKKLKR